MGLLTLFFGWKWRIRRLRKRWDRLREKALKKKGRMRAAVLERLDSTENDLRTLEEQRLNRVIRARMAKEVEIELEEVKAMLKSDMEELSEYQRIRGAENK
jgi:ethanolamine utilization protein EutQ (cupin superfamily)